MVFLLYFRPGFDFFVLIREFPARKKFILQPIPLCSFLQCSGSMCFHTHLHTTNLICDFQSKLMQPHLAPIVHILSMELLLLVGKEEKSKKIQHPNLFHTTVIQAKQEKPTFKRKTTKKKRKNVLTPKCAYAHLLFPQSKQCRKKRRVVFALGRAAPCSVFLVLVEISVSL